MSLGLGLRVVALLFLPLAALLAPTLLVAPLFPPGLRATWFVLAFVLVAAAFVVVGNTTYRWTGSRVAAALVTLASLVTGLVGLYGLLLWALTSAWE